MWHSEKPFENLMTRRELLVGLSFVPVHIFALPILIAMYNSVSGGNMTRFTINAVYCFIGVAVIVMALHNFLRTSLDSLLDRPGGVGLSLATAFFAENILNYLSLIVLLEIHGSKLMVLGETFTTMKAPTYGALFALTVFVEPFVTEVVFRGVVFGGLRSKNRALAYIVSIIVYALAGIWPQALAQWNPLTLTYALQFVPLGLTAAWVYDNTGSVWSPIFLHMLINFSALIVADL